MEATRTTRGDIGMMLYCIYTKRWFTLVACYVVVFGVPIDTNLMVINKDI